MSGARATPRGGDRPHVGTGTERMRGEPTECGPCERECALTISQRFSDFQDAKRIRTASDVFEANRRKYKMHQYLIEA
jgi:hypothetical protein